MKRREISRANSQIHTSMSENRLNAQSLLCIESELMHNIDFGDIIKGFSDKKARKVPVK